jgi:phosphoglycolate phosphatase-like HAD superfamily hydrolase
VAGLTAAEVVVVGDVADDARAAAEAGASCVLYDGGSQSRAVLERTGCPVVSSLVEAVGIAVGAPRR